MIEEEVVLQLAFISGKCKHYPTCSRCLEATRAEIDNAEFINTQLIEMTAVCIANTRGDYDCRTFTPLELRFAFDLLIDIVPYIKDVILSETKAVDI